MPIYGVTATVGLPNSEPARVHLPSISFDSDRDDRQNRGLDAFRNQPYRVPEPQPAPQLISFIGIFNRSPRAGAACGWSRNPVRRRGRTLLGLRAWARTCAGMATCAHGKRWRNDPSLPGESASVPYGPRIPWSLLTRRASNGSTLQ